MDGFDHYATADFTKKWTVETDVVITVNGRNGGGAFFNGSGVDILSKTIDAQVTWIVGFAFKPSTSSAARYFFKLTDTGSTQFAVQLNTDMTITVWSGGSIRGSTAVPAFALGEWSYVEIKVTIGNSGSYDINVDGVSVLAESVDTQATGNASANGIVFYSSGFGLDFYIDDVYMCDGTTGVNNDFLGDVMVETLFPDGDGNSSDLTPLSAGANYVEVDEAVQDGDTSYVYGSTATNKDLYTFDDLTTLDTIHGVQTNIIARKDDASGKTLREVCRSGSTDYPGATQSLTTSYSDKTEIRAVDPDTAAPWTTSGVNAAEFGVEIVA